MCAPLYELRRSTGSCGVSGRPSTSILTIALARTREHPPAVENQLRLPAVSIFSIRSWAEPSPRSRSHSWPPASHPQSLCHVGTLDQSKPTASARLARQPSHASSTSSAVEHEYGLAPHCVRGLDRVALTRIKTTPQSGEHREHHADL